MNELLKCEFNVDTGCVEAVYSDGSMITVDCTEVTENMYERSELDWLVYHAPVDYVNLVLGGGIKEYLKNVTEYHPFESEFTKMGKPSPGASGTGFSYTGAS